MKTSNYNYESLEYVLTELGRASPVENCIESALDYRKALNLDEADCDLLLDIALRYIDCVLNDDFRGHQAAVHAWRALAQFQYMPAVPELVGMMEPLSLVADPWCIWEFPTTLARFGPKVTSLAVAFLRDSSINEALQVLMAKTLYDIVKRHPDNYSIAVGAIQDALSRFERQQPEVNATYAAILVNLGSKDSAPLIEKAFAAGRISYGPMGGWTEVREILGVAGMGLIPDGHRVPLQTSTPAIAAEEPPGAPRNNRRQNKRKKRKKTVRAKNRKK